MTLVRTVTLTLGWDVIKSEVREDPDTYMGCELRKGFI